MGDTGQIIILGGEDTKGKYYCNELTYLFIECIKELKLPDPKILLRVSNNIPRELMKAALRCIKTGIGSPLLANDDQIISKLISFGYDKKDAYNYITSACWEPFIVGKSLEHNNIKTLVYMTPFLDMISNENLEKIKDTNDILKKYKIYLESYVIKIVNELKNIEFEEDPLMSLFVEECSKKLLDVTKGGALYNNFGFTSVSLANVVDSILSIEKYVFNDKKYTLNEFNNIRLNNYKNEEDLLIQIKNESLRFGRDNEKILKSNKYNY